MVVNSSNTLCNILPIFSHNSETREVKDSDPEDKCLTSRLIPIRLIICISKKLLMINKTLISKITRELPNLDRAKVSVEACPIILV